MAFQFKIQIKHITKPPVWRKLLVPEMITFERFHEIIQAAFGWSDYHVYQFSKTSYGADELIGIVDEDEKDDDNPFLTYTRRDASEVRLSEIFKQIGQKFIYIYDFGDEWTHQINLEAITEDQIINPELLAGKGACPPEDCGGPWGYANLREILSDRKNPEYKEMKSWLGLKAKQDWDPDYIDLESLRSIVRQS